MKIIFLQVVFLPLVFVSTKVFSEEPVTYHWTPGHSIVSYPDPEAAVIADAAAIGAQYCGQYELISDSYGGTSYTARGKAVRGVPCSTVSGYGVTYASAIGVADSYILMEPVDEHDPNRCEGNPIDPITGNKLQKEPLFTLDAPYPIEFSLYFNSKRVEKWRNNFSRSVNLTTLDSVPRYNFNRVVFGHYASPESTGSFGFDTQTRLLAGRDVLSPKSGSYGTRQQACETGWTFFKSNYHFSWLSASNASYIDNGKCEILVNGQRKMALDVYSLQRGRVAAYGGLDKTRYLRSTRENGRVISFELNTVDNTWENISNSGEKAEYIYDTDGMTVTGYRLFTNADEVEDYSLEGKLQLIKSPDGHVQSLTYVAHPDTGNMLIDRVENETGEYIDFEYEVFGTDNQFDRLLSVTDHTGRAWGFRYDALGNLEYVDNPDSTVRQYHYENEDFPYHLTGITDERNVRYATWSYNADGRAELSAHGVNADKDVVSIVYGDNGNRTVTKLRTPSGTGETVAIESIYETHSAGKRPIVTEIYGPGCSNCGTGDTISEYNAETGYLESEIKHGISTEYGNYDTKGNPGYIIEAVDTPEERRKDYTYDPRFHSKVETITEPSIYPGLNKITTYGYDDFGNITSLTIDGFKPDGTAISRTTSYQYNGPYHQLSQIDGPRTDVNDIINFEYYPNDSTQGNNRARLRHVRSADGTNLRSDISYTATGKVAGEYRSNNLYLGYAYSPDSDRLTGMLEYDFTNSIMRFTNWTYLPTGEVETITRAQGSGDETRLRFDYDDARRLTRITDGLGNYIEYILDSEGNVEKEDIYDVNGYLKKTLTQTFDSYDRLDNFSEKNRIENKDYSADGTLDKTTDGKGVVTDYNYDNLKRLTQVIQDQGGTDLTTANALTQYGYDVQDNLVSVVDANNGQTTYVYDDLGNLISQTSADTGTTNFTHDEAGNIATQTDAKAQLFTYSHDHYNRLTTLDAPGTEDDVSYVYDSCAGGYGRLCSVTRKNSTTSYQYNAMGDVLNVQQDVITWAGYNQSDNAMAYSYDGAGRVKTMTYPSGSEVAYSYDAAGQVSTVMLNNDTSQTILFDIEKRFPFGEINNAIFGNGRIYLGYVHNDYRPWVVSGAQQYTTLYYDQNGNPGTMYYPQGQSILMYDAHDRLDIVMGDLGSFDYDYDSVGNKTQYAQDGMINILVYDANSSRMNTLDGETIELDANGNTKNLRGMNMSFTADNRLKMTNTGVLFEYNGLGQRTKKKIMAPGIAGTYGYSQSVVYLYGLNGELLAEIGPTGKVVKEYIYLENKPLAMLDHQASSGEDFLNGDMDGDGSISLEDFLVYYFNHGNTTDTAYDVNGDGIKNGDDNQIMINCGLTQGNCEAASYSTSIYYIHNDHLGTPKLMTNEAGVPVWRATATPFGKASVNNDVDGDGETVTLNLRQPGQYYDRETGLYYNYYRYYDPETGRYITSDPIGLAGGINTYLYANGNPLKYVDPLGLDWFRPDGADYYVGRNGIPGFEPDTGFTRFLEDYVPAMHDMAIVHDRVVEDLRSLGYSDLRSNVPTMFSSWLAAVLANIFGDGYTHLGSGPDSRNECDN